MARAQVLSTLPTYYARSHIGQWYADIFANDNCKTLIYGKLPKLVTDLLVGHHYKEPHPKTGFADAIKKTGLIAMTILDETGYHKVYQSIWSVNNVAVDPISGTMELDIIERVAHLR
jgi:hypothetical protein